jgi:hypothetical protein
MKKSRPLSLSDRQLRLIMDAASGLEPDRREIFLQRVAAMLKFRSRSDDDIADVARLALAGLVHHADSAA